MELALAAPILAGLAGDALAPPGRRFEDEDRLLDWAWGRVFAPHLAPLATAVRRIVRIGARQLWGNAASAFAGAFRTVGRVGGPTLLDRARRDALRVLGRPPLAGLGAVAEVSDGERRGCFFERTSCCLLYRASEGWNCSDCSLLAPAERRARQRRALAEGW